MTEKEIIAAEIFAAKVDKELSEYRERMLALEKNQILQHSVEYALRCEIAFYLTENDIEDEDVLNALYALDNPIEAVFERYYEDYAGIDPHSIMEHIYDIAEEELW